MGNKRLTNMHTSAIIFNTLCITRRLLQAGSLKNIRAQNFNQHQSKHYQFLPQGFTKMLIKAVSIKLYGQKRLTNMNPSTNNCFTLRLAIVLIQAGSIKLYGQKRLTHMHTSVIILNTLCIIRKFLQAGSIKNIRAQKVNQH